LDEDETLDEQLEKRMKQLVYAKRPSAKEFYKTENEGEGLGFKSLSK
jgi:preprotein translocase subunit Sss1